jgi:DNA-binding MarR family transcriptional regulator
VEQRTVDNYMEYVNTSGMRDESNSESRITAPLLPCACANLRRASRAVTRVYNQELRTGGIEITQFTLLMALDLAAEIPQGKLGELLALDSTTLTRTLALLKKRGWVKVEEGEDRRLRIFSLTPAGKTKLQQSLPHWKRAQERFERALGPQRTSQLERLLVRAIRSSRDL